MNKERFFGKGKLGRKIAAVATVGVLGFGGAAACGNTEEVSRAKAEHAKVMQSDGVKSLQKNYPDACTKPLIETISNGRSLSQSYLDPREEALKSKPEGLDLNSYLEFTADLNGYTDVVGSGVDQSPLSASEFLDELPLREFLIYPCKK